MVKNIEFGLTVVALWVIAYQREGTYKTMRDPIPILPPHGVGQFFAPIVLHATQKSINKVKFTIFSLP